MPAATPISTYRLQLNKDFNFDAAAELVPYLKSLGITHVYSSPFLKARSGSTHGYDIVDHNALNPEFGGEEAFNRLSDALKAADMGLILDFVPNHMGVGHADNGWWLDVLEWGQKSPHAASFDISWELLPYRRGGGMLLPVLGRPYGDALESGEIELKYDAEEGSLSAWYFEHRFPISPPTYAELLKHVVEAAGAAEEPAGKAILAHASSTRSPSSPSYGEAPEFKRRLAQIEGAAAVIKRGLGAYRPHREGGAHALHRLLERQHYRLAYWRVAVSAINYRRFFDINDLAGLRVENPRTFRLVHELVARLIADGRLHGLRLDHIDGLLDPMQYTRRLAQLLRQVRGRAEGPFYVVVEKILAEDEPLPRFAGVAGTTGYEWLNVIARVLVDDRGLKPLDEAWHAFSGDDTDFHEVLQQSKLRVLRTILTSEFTVLTQLLARIAAGHYSTRDYTLDRLRAALQLYVLELPMYRTYLTAAGPSDSCREVISQTIRRARARWQGPDPEIFDFLQDVLTLDLLKDIRTYSRTRIRTFTMKLQQFTGPMMAKSLEDTTSYRYHRLIALNEVGGEPMAKGLSVAEFHARMKTRAVKSPRGLTATATHDTKRGEDARARILALSEIPGEWRKQSSYWRELNANQSVSPGHEYLIYQALVGSLPAEGVTEEFVSRMEAYALKAAREGKQETSWINPNEDYEAGLRDFVRRILDPGQSGQFLQSLEAFARRIALLGALNGLSQLVLKATIPGIPDFYQGTEFWDLSLVDPDNRRPVDYQARRAALDATRQPDWRKLAERWTDGHIKLALTQRLLSLRNSMPTLFRAGDYRPIGVRGVHRDHVLAFARTHGRDRVVVAVGRHLSGFTEAGSKWPSPDWDAELEFEGKVALRDALRTLPEPEPRSVQIRDLFQTLPVAVLRSS
jgi:(1->4)-alpha-D-glucan 1-alpha-D-glucosylmutase